MIWLWSTGFGARAGHALIRQRHIFVRRGHAGPATGGGGSSAVRSRGGRPCRLDASWLEVGQGYLADVEAGVHDRPDDLGVDEGGEFVELVAVGLLNVRRDCDRAALSSPPISSCS